ncbi:MAG: sel1 repeat family protein [Campylobacterales bacterium]|nr:sel1 repeat family protein [Campylobacterales bacterium]
MKKYILGFLFSGLVIASTTLGFLEALSILKSKNETRFEDAKRSLEILAEKNDVQAAYLLGYFYKNKEYKNYDLEKSHSYFLKAAKLGDKEAMLIIGWNYYKGIGCKRDLKNAKHWLEKLSIMGDEAAKEMLLFIYR